MFQPHILRGNQLLLRRLGLVLFIIASTMLCFTLFSNVDFEEAKRKVLMRRIGHELLLQSGDKTSRVLPITNSSPNQFEIHFEKNFAFRPETLVKISRNVFQQDSYITDYIVNVYRCAQSDPIYGFAISRNRKNDIITCVGRIQPKACYFLSIQLRSDVPFINSLLNFLMGFIYFLALLLVILSYFTKSYLRSPIASDANEFVLGKYTFDYTNKLLRFDQETSVLTATESRLLYIFANVPNQVVTRNRLQKEIWEDEGVIVGRSLDMFISKLRKKLEKDPKTNIIVVRSKGYKLQIEA